ncbi:hypothetical protein VTI74DRAFT_8227 [Chaetomium olivicolor]
MFVNRTCQAAPTKQQGVTVDVDQMGLSYGHIHTYTPTFQRMYLPCTQRHLDTTINIKGRDHPDLQLSSRLSFLSPFSSLPTRSNQTTPATVAPIHGLMSQHHTEESNANQGRKALDPHPVFHGPPAENITCSPPQQRDVEDMSPADAQLRPNMPPRPLRPISPDSNDAPEVLRTKASLRTQTHISPPNSLTHKRT